MKIKKTKWWLVLKENEKEIIHKALLEYKTNGFTKKDKENNLVIENIINRLIK